MRSLCATSLLACLSLACAGAFASTEIESTRRVAAAYYEALAGERDFSSVPMAEDLSFQGPGRSASSARAFREALSGLSPRVRGFRLRQQLSDGEFVMSFYDLDLGVPGGPIPMAEKLRIEAGQIVEVELLFDSRRMAGPPQTQG